MRVMTESRRPLALVTRASSGIGLELIKQFAEHDYDPVINSQDAGLEEVAEQLRHPPPAVGGRHPRS